MGKKERPQREFDWSSANFLPFLLKIAYVGTNYAGFAWQEGPQFVTVEGKVFEALTKTKLIKDRHSCNYSRCARTDKGVHALGNYVSLLLRVKPRQSGPEDHYDYPLILNAVLPPDIRCLAARPVPPHFDARFHCLYRVYKYYFVPAGLDLSRMREAAALLVGEHDFRNFCKIDVEQVKHFRRRILSVNIEQADPFTCVATITGLSYLWHQIRCIMAVLFLVGRALEQPRIVSDLLDVKKHPRRPLYDMAEEHGLILHECFFEGVHFDTAADMKPLESFRDMYLQSLRMSSVYRCMAMCEAPAPAAAAQPSTVGAAADPWGHLLALPELQPRPPKTHIPLLERPTCASYEEKLANYENSNRNKKRKAAGADAAEKGVKEEGCAMDGAE